MTSRYKARLSSSGRSSVHALHESMTGSRTTRYRRTGVTNYNWVHSEQDLVTDTCHRATSSSFYFFGGGRGGVGVRKEQGELVHFATDDRYLIQAGVPIWQELNSAPTTLASHYYDTPISSDCAKEAGHGRQLAQRGLKYDPLNTKLEPHCILRVASLRRTIRASIHTLLLTACRVCSYIHTWQF